MTLELARRLLATGAIAARDVEAALYLSVVRGVSIARALVDRGVLGERTLEEELSRRAGPPLRQVNPAADIVTKLPRGMCRMLAAVPLRFDQASGVTEVAAVDPLDGHVASEFTFHLGTPIRLQRATMESIEEAIRRFELAEGAGSGRSRRRTPAFPHGAPDTVPPAPPSKPPEEVPIPLVRRVAPGSASIGPTAEVLEEEETLDLDRPSIHDEPTVDMTPRPPRRVLRSAPDIPSVSFPSAPPPSTTGMELAGALESAADAYAAIAQSSLGGASNPPPSDEAIGLLLEADEEPTRVRPASGPHARVSIPPASPSEAPAAPPVRSASDEHPAAPANIDARGSEEKRTTGPIVRTPDAGWSPTLPELLDLIGRARARDDLLDLVLRAVTLVAQRAAVFVVRKEGFTGWSCNPAFGSEEDLKRVVIPSTQPSIFATSAAAGFYLGPIPRTNVHASLLAVFTRSTSDVAVYVAKIRSRPTIVIVADQLDDTLMGTRALGEIAKRAGEALARLLAQR
ncbi:MAG: hypothetical protein HOW73_33355 [Polyangiaceae bacterium]|nr:hypothetical protein [Polyangiaceae bacterium]